MSKFYHITREGKKILLQDLDDDHLDNIINHIERKSKEGILVGYGSEMLDPDELDTDWIYEDDAKDFMNYDYYVKEKERRRNETG